MQPLFNAAVNMFDYNLKNTGFSRANAGLAGNLYCAVSGFVTISQNNYYSFYFSNPSTSVITAQFDIVEASTKQLVNANILKDITSFTSTGTLTPCNFNPSFPDSSVISVQIASNASTNPVTGGTSICAYISDVPFNINYDGGITLAPGHNIAMSFQNKGANGESAVNVMWWEFDP